MALAYTATEMMTAAAARALKSSDVCFVGIDLPSLGFRVTAHEATENATHIVLRK